MDIPLLVAVVAVLASIYTALSSSTRSEAHHQAFMIQSITKELSDVIFNYNLSIQNCDTHFKNTTPDCLACERSSAVTSSFEVLCSLKCDQIESTIDLLVRRCTREFFFDANAQGFKHTMTELVGKLRDRLSSMARHGPTDIENLNYTHALLNKIYSDTNYFMGERFRKIIEKDR